MAYLIRSTGISTVGVAGDRETWYRNYEPILDCPKARLSRSGASGCAQRACNEEITHAQICCRNCVAVGRPGDPTDRVWPRRVFFAAGNFTQVEMSEPNYKVVATSVAGEAEAAYLIGVAFSNGPQSGSRVPASSQRNGQALHRSHGEPMAGLRSRARLSGGSTTGPGQCQLRRGHPQFSRLTTFP